MTENFPHAASGWQAVVSRPGELGESPFWHPEEQMLYWVDIPARQIHRLNTFTGSVQSWAMPSEPGCVAPARAESLRGTGGDAPGVVIALRDGIYRASEWGGALQQIAPALHDPAAARFNDGKVDVCGRLWASTIFEPRVPGAAKLFSLDCRNAPQEGEEPALQVRANNATTGNGLAWSPDNKTVYWADTPAHCVRAWDWDSESNAMSGERVFMQWPAKPAGWQPGMPGYEGRPDGAAVDVQGNYYIAMFEGARLFKLSPEGEVLAVIPVPAQCPTMPCFGGSDLKTLYLTTARENRPATELSRYPDSGCVFAMQVDIPGLPVNFFID